MEVKSLRPWRTAARNFEKKPANMNEKLWLVKEIVLHGETAASLSKLYGIRRKSLNSWTRAYRLRGILHENLGRPAILTDCVKKDIICAMTNNVKTFKEYESIVQEAHKKNVMSHSSTSSCQINQLSRRSVRRIQDELGIRTGTAEQTTDTRGRDCDDKINAVSTTAAHHTMTPLPSPYLVSNADGMSSQTVGKLTDLVKR